MIKLIRKNYLLIILIIWLSIIFIFSQQGIKDSTSITDNTLKSIHTLTKSNADLKDFILSNRYIIRKVAHFIEYFILGIIVYFFERKYLNKSFYLSFIICAVLAIFDEIHQLFVPGRTFLISDIVLDTFASFLSILILYIIFNVAKRKSL